MSSPAADDHKNCVWCGAPGAPQVPVPTGEGRRPRWRGAGDYGGHYVEHVRACGAYCAQQWKNGIPYVAPRYGAELSAEDKAW